MCKITGFVTYTVNFAILFFNVSTSRQVNSIYVLLLVPFSSSGTWNTRLAAPLVCYFLLTVLVRLLHTVASFTNFQPDNLLHHIPPSYLDLTDRPNGSFQWIHVFLIWLPVERPSLHVTLDFSSAVTSDRYL